MDHFRFLAPIYDRFMGAPDVERLTSLLTLPSDGWLLDLSGGTGRASLPLRPLVRGIMVCDISRPMLHQARNKGAVAVCAPAERLPFPDRCFARVLVVDALHHFRSAPHVVAEIVRVLAPGGRIVIEDFDLGQPLVRLLALAERLAMMRCRFFHAEEIRRMLVTHGLNAHIQRGRRLATYVIANIASTVETR